MLCLTKHTHRATPSVTKLVCMVLSAAIVVLCAISRPTDLQVKVIGSVWRENALYIMAMHGLVFSAVSFMVFTFIGLQNKFGTLKYADIGLHIIGCICYLFCGAAMLYSTLIILSKLGNCCREVFNQTPNVTVCDLPGFEGVELFKFPEKLTHQRILEFLEPRYREPLGIVAPDISECADDVNYDYGRCTTCLNKVIQPRYDWKGAAGALGILIAIFYAVIAIISIQEVRTHKANARAALRRSY